MASVSIGWWPTACLGAGAGEHEVDPRVGPAEAVEDADRGLQDPRALVRVRVEHHAGHLPRRHDPQRARSGANGRGGAVAHRAGLAVVLSLSCLRGSRSSRSGRGAHIWIFFSEAVPAVLARKLGCHILTETMEHNPDIGLDSYDRLFPNQDTLPRGSFGNLIALPLQKVPRQDGNSVFVDEQLQSIDDQWAFLANIKKAGCGRRSVILNPSAGQLCRWALYSSIDLAVCDLRHKLG